MFLCYVVSCGPTVSGIQEYSLTHLGSPNGILIMLKLEFPLLNWDCFQACRNVVQIHNALLSPGSPEILAQSECHWGCCHVLGNAPTIRMPLGPLACIVEHSHILVCLWSCCSLLFLALSSSIIDIISSFEPAPP